MQGQVEGDAIQLVQAAQYLSPPLGTQEGAAGVVPLTATKQNLTLFKHTEQGAMPCSGTANPVLPMLSPEALGVEQAELQGLG